MESLNIFAYLNVVWRRKWLIIVPMLIMGVGAFVGSNFIPKEYVSHTTILVEEQKLMNPLISGLAVSSSVYNRLPSTKEQILSWNNILALIKRLGLDKRIRSQQELEKIVNEFRRNIYVVMPKNKNVVIISFRGRDPIMVRDVVKIIADNFIKQNLEAQGREASTAIEFIKNQIALYRYKIKQDELRQYKKKLKDLLVDSTEKHPLVIDLRKKIKKLEEELKKEEAIINSIKEPQTEDEKKVYAELMQEYSRIKQNLDNLDDEADAIKKDKKINEEIYAMLKKRLETARLTQRLESSKQGLKFRILDPPLVPTKPVKPNRIKYTVFGLMVGFALGFFLMILAELLDTSLKGVQDAKSFLSPMGKVIGEISWFNLGELEKDVREVLRSGKKSI